MATNKTDGMRLAPEPEPRREATDGTRADDRKGPLDWLGPYCPRTPVYYLKTFSGARNDPTATEQPDEAWDRERGIARPFRGFDGVKHMREEIARVVEDLGATRVLLNRPGGTALGHHVGAGQWLSMHVAKREAMAEALADLEANYPGLEIIPFIGASANLNSDPSFAPGLTTTDPMGSANYSIGQFGEALDRQSIGDTLPEFNSHFSRAFWPWVHNSPGPTAIDSATTTEAPTEYGPSNHRRATIEMSKALSSLDPSKYFIGEALPTNGTERDSEGNYDPDLYAMSQIPWLASRAFIRGYIDPSGNSARNVRARFPTTRFNIQTTRLFVWYIRKDWYADHDAMRANIERDVIDGYIPIVGTDEAFAHAQATCNMVINQLG